MPRNMKIFAHRGESGLFPENTMIAFQGAFDAGSHGIELDVQMTKDGELVVIHDERIERTTNGIGFVKDLSLKQLKKYDAGSWFHSDYHKESIPTLQEVLNWVRSLPKELIVNIELKNDIIEYQKIEEKVLELIYQMGLQHQSILSSFNIKSLRTIYELDNKIETALLFEGVPINILDLAKGSHVHALHCEAVFAQSIIARKVNQQGFPLRVYTINTLNDFNALQNTCTSVVMTDFPLMFLR